MLQIDVRPDHLAIIRSVLKEFVPGYRVVAFGSRVNDKARDTSDLDLCIMSHKRISFETLGYLRDALSESNVTSDGTMGNPKANH